MSKEFTRVAIIDHARHTLFVEDIPNDILNNQYNGEEEDYIKDNYDLGPNFSWDYIIDSQYFSGGLDCDPITINYEEL